MANIMVIWRGKQLCLEVDPTCNVKELGQMLQELTSIKPETMRLLVPQSANKSSKLITPFSDAYSSLHLQDVAILEGKSIRMMGAVHEEIEEVSENVQRPDLRIIGFEDEEKRLKQRMSTGPQSSLKLPQGPYIIRDFRTLHLPGTELNPPQSEALKRMHMLACDPGIIAIMNKHRWRVGIMTEMAPIGYVGVTPKCILGFNKNMGEEISLRLRTDDLKGFRKYESIKKTLLHELAHMVYSEHDANFFALNKKLNEEAAALDWTKSKSHTLSGRKIFETDEELCTKTSNGAGGQKLGRAAVLSASAHASSVAAVYEHSLNTPTVGSRSQITVESDHPDVKEDCGSEAEIEPDPDDSDGKLTHDRMQAEPDTDNHKVMRVNTIMGHVKHTSESSILEGVDAVAVMTVIEPDPDDSMNVDSTKTGPIMNQKTPREPDPDDSVVSDSDNMMETQNSHSEESKAVKAEPDPDHIENSENKELQRIEEPVAAMCARLQKTIGMLRSEIMPSELASVLGTLFKIIRNVVEHPNEVKFKRLRKANPQFQRNVANYKAAMEVLKIIGFCEEDEVVNGVGRAETYMVLKRNDPGLLWLAKSSLELSMA